MKLLHVDAAESDDMHTEASVFSSYSQNVCSSIVKNENNFDQSTNNTDKGYVAVEETCMNEKESSPKHSETSYISSAKHGAEVKNGGTKRPAL